VSSPFFDIVPASFWRHRHLIWQMTRREVVGRYRGSWLGLLWSFFHPVLMLAVYTFVFSVVFQARWGDGDGVNRAEFAIVLFAGLIIFNLFAEIVNRSPNLILEHPNLVKKVVFPLEILPVVAAGSALFHAGVSLIVLLLFELAVRHSLPATALYLPLILLPFLTLTLGLSWLLASLGVYIRDVAQTVGIATTALMFVSPIFFPLSALPEEIRPFLQLNPLALIIEQARAVLVFGVGPAWTALAGYGAMSLLGGLFGLWSFHKLRRGFADVL